MTKPAIPPEVLAQHTAIIGKTGSGKTSTSKLAVEQVVGAGYPVCILDTIKSDWWGITSSSNGTEPGLPFKILGGPRGHVPLHASAGKAIGQLVGEGKLPLSIIDMADFEPGGVQKFFSDFAPALMRHAKGVLYLVIEEAHEVAPKERAGFGAENMAIHWAKKLATAGRSKGIRLIVATQRVQNLHNAVLGSCETLIAHRLSTPADKAPVIAWLKSNADKATAAKVESSMSSLPTGTGWLCSGEARIFQQIKFPKFATYDNAKTPTGDDVGRDVKMAPVDAAELRAIIGDAVAEAEANDPKALKAQVADLKRQLGATTTRSPTAADALSATLVAQEVRTAVSKALAEERPRIFEEGRRVGDAEGEKRALSRVAAAVASVKPGDATLTALPPRPAVGTNVRDVRPVPKAPELRALVKPHDRGETSNSDVTGPQRRVLNALAWWRALGHLQPSRPMVAAIAQLSPNASHFSNTVSSLRTAGLVIYPPQPGLIEMTPEGIAVSGTVTFERPAFDIVRERLTGPQMKIYDALSAGNEMNRADVAAAAGLSVNASHFSNTVSSLKTLGLVEYPSKGTLRLSDWIFTEAA